MKHTLLLRLAGPMQAWGVQSRFSNRDTLLEPTKSGVVGLVCAAMDIERGDVEQMRQIASLRMGVRVDREGVRQRDYHTAGRDGFLRADGTREYRNVIPSERFFLADAWFIVGLEGEDVSLLQEMDRALGSPRWPLWLGRKSMPPATPVRMTEGKGIVPLPLEKALGTFVDPYWKAVLNREPPRPVRFVFEQDTPSSNELAFEGRAVAVSMRPDQPVNFADRRFRARTIYMYPPPETGSP